MTYSKPKLIGFWNPEGPDPRELVAQDFYGAELPFVVRYLQSGQRVDFYLGYSYCRFGCGIPDRNMGSADLSDGEWVWPEGLSHYVEVHGVRLPEEFISTMRSNSWQPPKREITLCPYGPRYDSTFWISWSAQQTGMPLPNPEPLDETPRVLEETNSGSRNRRFAIWIFDALYWGSLVFYGLVIFAVSACTGFVARGIAAASVPTLNEPLAGIVCFTATLLFAAVLAVIAPRRLHIRMTASKKSASFTVLNEQRS